MNNKKKGKAPRNRTPVNERSFPKLYHDDNTTGKFSFKDRTPPAPDPDGRGREDDSQD